MSTKIRKDDKKTIIESTLGVGELTVIIDPTAPKWAHRSAEINVTYRIGEIEASDVFYLLKDNIINNLLSGVHDKRIETVVNACIKKYRKQVNKKTVGSVYFNNPEWEKEEIEDEF